jgi:hypothetical protein
MREKFVVLHKLPNGQAEIVGFRIHTDRHQASLLSGVLNHQTGTNDFTMYELHACAGPKPAAVDQAIADYRKAKNGKGTRS